MTRFNIHPAFTKEFERILNESTPGKQAPFLVSNVQIDWKPDYPCDTGFGLALFSVFLPFLSVVKSKSDCPYTVLYKVMDSKGQGILNRNLTGRVQGYIAGWYLGRITAGMELMTKEADFIGRDSARAVMRDLYDHVSVLNQAAGIGSSKEPDTSLDRPAVNQADTGGTAVVLPPRNWPAETLAVADLTAFALSQGEVGTLTDKLRSILTQTKYFKVVSREDMMTVLKEQQFQKTDRCDDTQCLIEMGKLLVVKKNIGGTIGKVGGTYTLSLRMVNVETGEVEVSVDRTFKGEPDQLLTLIEEVANGLALQYAKGKK